jgi:hypothetical protein
VLLLGLSIVLGAREADAQTGDNEIALTVEPDFIVATGDDAAYGAGVQGIVSWGFHPLWNLFGLVDYGHLFVPDEDGSDQNLSSLMAGVGVNLDVVTLVPWGRIGIGGRYDSRLKVLDGAPLDAAVMLEVGLDYRKRRNWAVGFSIQARSAFRPDFRPVDRVRIGLRFSWIRETDRIRY